MKKAMKVILVLIMLFSAALSVSTLISVKLNSIEPMKGHWVTVGTKVICNPPGTQCDVVAGGFDED